MIDDDGDDTQIVASNRGQQFIQAFSQFRPSIDTFMEGDSVLGGRSYEDAFGYTDGAYPDDPVQFGGGATTNHYGPSMPLLLENGATDTDVGGLGQLPPLPEGEDDEL